MNANTRHSHISISSQKLSIPIQTAKMNAWRTEKTLTLSILAVISLSLLCLLQNCEATKMEVAGYTDLHDFDVSCFQKRAFTIKLDILIYSLYYFRMA